ncbi:hypothetical protein AB1Y20_023379 [Prymnesium parvum]|uniref:Protein kinase domain-containing protein n=1 Tax=Prymnesium parvum TaxID=97485 RepID=A0AB34JE51_PRYPA
MLPSGRPCAVPSPDTLTAMARDANDSQITPAFTRDGLPSLRAPPPPPPEGTAPPPLVPPHPEEGEAQSSDDDVEQPRLPQPREGRAALSRQEAPDAAREGARPHAPPFEALIARGLLGYGTYAVLKLVEDFETGSLYTLKAFNKERMARGAGMAEAVQKELRMASLVAHLPHMLQPIAMYHDESAFYLLREVALRGTLRQLMERQGLLQEPEAKFYVAQATLALAHLHSARVVLRNLQPEHLLVDADGYLKLADLATAKQARAFPFTSPPALSGQGPTA